MNAFDVNLMTHVIEARMRIRSALNTYHGALFLGHSGGKDSCVIYDLTIQVCPEIRVTHNPKADTHPDTVQFIYDLSVQRPVNFVRSADMPSFIQANGLECQIDGTRRDEATRNEKSTDLIVDGENVSRENMPAFVKRGIFGLSMLYPIFNWTEQQVWEYLKYNGIKVSKEYTE